MALCCSCRRPVNEAQPIDGMKPRHHPIFHDDDGAYLLCPWPACGGKNIVVPTRAASALMSIVTLWPIS